mmetsp:Transcript_2046/g.2898  ORF Transcript_2046/g.2898 Transcript_2046/m.2898 type:complete len:505 (-) Transcript_2046:1841-3355(-)
MTQEESSSTARPRANREENSALSLEELLYSSSSYHAIAVPVTITMILSALTVIYINTDETIEAGEDALSVYETFHPSSEASTAQNLGISLVNTLIMVCVIGAMTFVIVLLYKYRCMKILLGYMMFSSAMLLGFLGGVIFDVAINKYELDIDQFSFYFFLVNFASVGVAAIFWQKGIPRYVTQGYLISTSVILSWQLSHFNAWTAWALLFMLALYDLCAVLTPCGPLKALVNLMQRDNAPEMPGLLYEAQLPREARRPGSGTNVAPSTTQQIERPSPGSTDQPVGEEEVSREHPETLVTDDSPITGFIPLAIAKLYRLSLTEPVQTSDSFTPLLEDESEPTTNDALAQHYTTEQLVTEVEAVFPRGGGRIDREDRNGEVRYVVKDRHGIVKRILLVDDSGRVLEQRQTSGDDAEEDDNSIKLGLGDFIFYSLLTAKAAQYSFATFAACMLVILAGLGGTLVLLAVYRHALPALPISIALGIVFYLLTRVVIEPWIETIFQMPLYV